MNGNKVLLPFLVSFFFLSFFFEVSQLRVEKDIFYFLLKAMSNWKIWLWENRIDSERVKVIWIVLLTKDLTERKEKEEWFPSEYLFREVLSFIKLCLIWLKARGMCHPVTIIFTSNEWWKQAFGWNIDYFNYFILL